MEFWAKHWRAVVGVLLLFGPLMRGIRWLFEALGNIALIADHLAVVAIMFEYLTDPPAWTTLPFIFAGLALIYWDRRQPAEAAMPSTSIGRKPIAYRGTPSSPTEAENFRTLYEVLLLPAAMGAAELMTWLADLAQSKTQDFTISHYGPLLRTGVIEREAAARSRLKAAIDSETPVTRFTLNNALMDYYREYLSMRSWIAVAPDIVGAKVGRRSGFDKWLEQDRKFIQGLRQFSGARESLIGSMMALGWGEKTSAALSEIAGSPTIFIISPWELDRVGIRSPVRVHTNLPPTDLEVLIFSELGKLWYPQKAVFNLEGDDLVADNCSFGDEYDDGKFFKVIVMKPDKPILASSLSSLPAGTKSQEVTVSRERRS